MVAPLFCRLGYRLGAVPPRPRCFLGDLGSLLWREVTSSGLAFGCFRCLLLVICTYPVAKEALTRHLARSEGNERYFGCNLMHRNVLASSHQHLMAEAPTVRSNASAVSSASRTEWYW